MDDRATVVTREGDWIRTTAAVHPQATEAAGPVVLDSAGKPVRRDTRCPRCQAPASKRVTAANFGRVRAIVCGVCGEDTGEVAT